MRRIVFEVVAAIAITLAAVIASVHEASAGDLAITGAFARASASPQAQTGAAYLTITNGGPAADQLQAIASPAAGMAMVHETKDDNGTSSMMAVAAVPVPAGGSVSLKPGGMHIMLMDLKAPLKQGETLRLELTFAKAGQIGVDVPIKGIAAMSP